MNIYSLLFFFYVLPKNHLNFVETNGFIVHNCQFLNIFKYDRMPFSPSQEYKNNIYKY